MGYGFNFECISCDYKIRLFIGAGMRYSPQAVYYGFSDDPDKDWSVAPRDSRNLEMPMLFSLVDDEKVADFAWKLIRQGAEPTGWHWLSLYVCSTCWRLYNRFFFQLTTDGGIFEPEYWCEHCARLLEQTDFDFNAREVQLVSMYDRHLLDWHCPQCGEGGLVQSSDRFVWN